jgi:hypothetical protein
MSPDSDIENIKLASNITVKKYKELEAERNKSELAKFIYERFSERYIIPIESMKRKNGFTTMAVSCLMIEVFQSFREGLGDTNGKSIRCFKLFFKSTKGFECFTDYESKFYYNVRCGILHQAETTGGWKIYRKGVLFDKDNLSINATLFLSHLKASLKEYQSQLENQDWDDELWKNSRKKMAAVIDNCKREGC